MPSYFSDLKSVYKRTYEELKNPKSPIAVFLEKIDDYERLENAGPIKTAIAEYIKVYEEEEKNFKERHQKMKSNYNDLYLLYYEVEVYCANNDNYSEERFEEFSKRYVKLLNDVENHTNQDYWLYNIENTLGNKPYVRYYLCQISFWIFIISLFIIPMLCVGVSLGDLMIRMYK